MICAAPHFLMLCESQDSTNETQSGNWRFLCQQINGKSRIEVADSEPEVKGERLQLLAVVRGLESLEQPSRVSLITTSRYVGRGIRQSLSTWRDNNWRWEHFGVMRPIKHGDLWKRIDRAMSHHDVECRVWNFETSRPPVRTRFSPQATVKQTQKPAGQQLKNWAQELAAKMAAFGLAPVTNYAIR